MWWSESASSSNVGPFFLFDRLNFHLADFDIRLKIEQSRATCWYFLFFAIMKIPWKCVYLTFNQSLLLWARSSWCLFVCAVGSKETLTERLVSNTKDFIWHKTVLPYPHYIIHTHKIQRNASNFCLYLSNHIKKKLIKLTKLSVWVHVRACVFLLFLSLPPLTVCSIRQMLSGD